MIFPTLFGWAGIAASDQGITMVVLPKKSKQAVERELRSAGGMPAAKGPAHQSVRRGIQLLEAYFSGQPVAFDLPLDIRYYTAFQQAVWRAAMQIPFGETRPYAWIAKKIRRPRAFRAVGQAMGANPIPIMIP